MGIIAQRLGRFVAPTGQGTVFSVHDHVVNLAGRPGDNVTADPSQAPELPDDVPLLVSLVSRERDMTDLAIHVSAVPKSLQPGDPVAWSDTSGEPAGAIATERGIVTASAARWNGSLPETAEIRQLRAKVTGGNAGDGKAREGSGESADRSGEVMDQLAAALAAALADTATEESFRGVVLDRDENPFARRAATLVGSGTDAEWPAGESGAAGLVGLGIGFTPSGDDFLAGALLAERLLDWEGAVPETDRRAIAANLGRTTPGGRTLVWLALQGSFPAYLMDLAEALATATVSHAGTAGDAVGFDQVVRDACAAAFRHGETSGMDAVSGLTWAFRRLRASLTADRRRV